MVTKSSVYSLVIECVDSLNNKEIKEIDLLNYLKSNDSVVFYAFIKHDRDLDEFGELVHQHYHLVVKLKSSFSKLTLVNDIASGMFMNKCLITISPVKSFVKCVQYLIHFNDKEKYQYDVIDIWSNDYNEVTSCIYGGVSSYEIDIDYLVDLIRNSNSLTKVYRTLGLSKSRTYRALISDMWRDKFKYHEV